jgi:hypothetical protein
MDLSCGRQQNELGNKVTNFGGKNIFVSSFCGKNYYSSLPFSVAIMCSINLLRNEMGGACSWDERGESRVQGFGGRT